MENGGGIAGGGNLVRSFSALAVSSSSESPNSDSSNNNNDGLLQIIRAVEAADALIKQKGEENTRLRTELQKKIQELEIKKSDDSKARRFHSVDQRDDRVQGELVPNTGDSATQTLAEGHLDNNKINGTMKLLPGGQDNDIVSQLSSPSAASFSPGRFLLEREYNPRYNVYGHALMPMADINNPITIAKQILEHEEEISQLRKHLTEYSIKEAQTRTEKYVLEKRIAYMRLAFDQQQQDLVDAASKALSYRQDIIEENARLTYALQDAQQERSTFVSSLLPLLAEYSLQPPVPDAQSIVSNFKVLCKHLQETLNVTEAKLNESQYHLAPWRSDENHSNFAPQSPAHSFGIAQTVSNKNGLELVPQPTYFYGNTPISSSDPQTAADWDLLRRHQDGLGGGASKETEHDLGRYSHVANRDTTSQDGPGHPTVSQDKSNFLHYGKETTNKQVTFSDPVSRSVVDDFYAEGQQSKIEPSANWGSKNSSYTPLDPSTPYSHHLPPVLEESCSSVSESSISEAGDDYPLPAIEGLQISGDAFPGWQLQACGYPMNGTTNCNFEWVRHLEDGSVNYIEGAWQPNYLVTADDVDTYLAIEVQPLDNRKRKGELVQVFANEHRKITCDPEMHNHIEKTLYDGHASYWVSLPTGYLDIWESATLAIKRGGYSIKCSGSSGVVVAEKFSPTTSVNIPFGKNTEFSIIGSGGNEHILRADTSLDSNCSRDTIVLVMRFFIKRAGEKRKGKKRGLFFNK